MASFRIRIRASFRIRIRASSSLSNFLELSPVTTHHGCHFGDNDSCFVVGRKRWNKQTNSCERPTTSTFRCRHHDWDSTAPLLCRKGYRRLRFRNTTSPDLGKTREPWRGGFSGCYAEFLRYSADVYVSKSNRSKNTCHSCGVICYRSWLAMRLNS